MKTLQIDSNIKNYSVYFSESLEFFANFAAIDNKVVIIDQNVLKLYENPIWQYFSKDEVVTFEATEENKNVTGALKLVDELIKQKAKRNLTLISIGGGITQDVTGFVASILYRGINWIFIPTTFLAQTDSCIGSKTSLNYQNYKNLLGTFYPPAEIYIAPVFLKTLEKIDFYSGIGEAIKFQLMKEEAVKNYDNIIEHINSAIINKSCIIPLIYENLSIKISYMKNDEFDLGRRNFLNYGHCFGHALETSSEYYIPHGVAVTVGIMFANIISCYRNKLSKTMLDKLNYELLLPNIPLKIEHRHLNRDAILTGMKNDKKRIGQDLTVIIPDENMNMIKISDLKDDEFDKALVKLIRLIVNIENNKG